MDLWFDHHNFLLCFKLRRVTFQHGVLSHGLHVCQKSYSRVKVIMQMNLGVKGYQWVPGVDISSPGAGYEKAMTLGRY